MNAKLPEWASENEKNHLKSRLLGAVDVHAYDWLMKIGASSDLP